MHFQRSLFVLCVLVAASINAAEPVRVLPPPTSLSLGDVSADLVYTPLAPCRIIDTRSGGGILSAGASRGFFVKGVNGFELQGGNAGGCGVPDKASAVLINFVAVLPQGNGNLRGAAYPFAVPATGSILNYQQLNPTMNVANAVAFPVCYGSPGACTFDIVLLANVSATHLVADVLGYFSRFAIEEVVSSITAGTGLEGGGVGSVMLGIAPGGVGATEIDSTAVQRRVSGSCEAGTMVASIGSDGSVVCTSAPTTSRVFTAGTYTLNVPVGVSRLLVEAWGGGGGGAGAVYIGVGYIAGPGGGGGAYVRAVLNVATTGPSIPIVVGGGGSAGGLGGNGGPGGATSLTGLLSVGGGTGGVAIGGGGFGGGYSGSGSASILLGGGGVQGQVGGGGFSGLDALHGKNSGGNYGRGGSGGETGQGSPGLPGLLIVTFGN